jgi:thioredoxin reductase (NADPH)
MTDERHSPLIILGSGPAGYSAAVYAARANRQPLLITGLQEGGQLMTTTDVDNWPGDVEGLQGPALMQRMRRHAERFGTRIVFDHINTVDLGRRPLLLRGDSGEYTCDALIVATGASARYLGLESEEKYRGKGVSACATCDGSLFRGQAIAVVGGGDTAMEEALFLTRFGSSVTVIHRRDRLRASKIMQERALRNSKIRFVWDSAVEEVLGKDGVEAVRLVNLKTDERSVLPVGALFVAIGHRPNSDLVRGVLDMDPAGYIRVQPGSSRTNIEGVFACGDVTDPTYRQAVTAAGTGCMAALDAERWLASRE